MAKQLIIHGRVQGVGYRESLRCEAERLGVTGWVRNRLDGTVEAVIDGPSDAVDALIDWAKTGPPAARVDRLEIDEAPGGFDSFERRPTV